MINSTHSFKSTDQTRSLFLQKFQKSKNPKATLVLTHGLGEHSDAYRDFIIFLCESLPLQIIAWDMTGHGRSEGQRGYVGDIQWMVKDFTELLNSQLSKDLPVFTFSHSLGALINLYAEQESAFEKLNMKGCIFSNPGLQLNFTPPKWKTKAANLLAQMLPKTTLGNEISPEQLSSDKDYIKENTNDSLRHTKISPRLFLGMLDLQSKVKKRVSAIPSLSLLSTNDPVCSSKASNFVLSTSSEVVFFENSLHEILNDIEKDKAYKKIKEFINENT